MTNKIEAKQHSKNNNLYVGIQSPLHCPRRLKMDCHVIIIVLLISLLAIFTCIQG